MTHNEFNHIISSINALSSDQMRRLYRELERRIAATKPTSPASAGSGRDTEETAFDVAQRAGLIGCIQGQPGSPTDLSTNPKHMEGFGRG